MIELGSKCKHRFTGFKGTATGRCEYFNGCVQYLIQPSVGKDNIKGDGVWIDEQFLIVVSAPSAADRKAAGLTSGKKPGGPDRSQLPVQ